MGDTGMFEFNDGEPVSELIHRKSSPSGSPSGISPFQDISGRFDSYYAKVLQEEQEAEKRAKKPSRPCSAPLSPTRASPLSKSSLHRSPSQQYPGSSNLPPSPLSSPLQASSPSRNLGSRAGSGLSLSSLFNVPHSSPSAAGSPMQRSASGLIARGCMMVSPSKRPPGLPLPRTLLSSLLADEAPAREGGGFAPEAVVAACVPRPQSQGPFTAPQYNHSRTVHLLPQSVHNQGALLCARAEAGAGEATGCVAVGAGAGGGSSFMDVDGEKDRGSSAEKRRLECLEGVQKSKHVARRLL
eukprot:gene14125-20084_t